MTRQWRHKGQVTVHLLPVWQLFLEVYRNQERWLLMSQHIFSILLFVPHRSCARSSTESRRSPSAVWEKADTDRSVLSFKIWRQALQRWASFNKMYQFQVPGIIILLCVIPRGDFNQKIMSSVMKSRCRWRQFRPKVMKYPAKGKRISWVNFRFYLTVHLDTSV